MWFRLWIAVVLVAIVSFADSAMSSEAPKRGGTLTYLIPADAPPSFDGHREATYATVHAAAPFYSDGNRDTQPGMTTIATGPLSCY